MTKESSRISRSPKKFNSYICTTDDRLQAIEPVSGFTYGKLYGLTDPNIADWHTKRTAWDTPITGLYAQYSNPVTSSSPLKKKVKDFITEFHTFGNPLLNIIAASPNATADEEKIFNLILDVDHAKPSKTHTKIADQCITGWEGEGAGTKKASSRSTEDSTRASVVDGADGVQYAYVIMDDNPKTVAARTAAVVNTNNANTTARFANPTVQAYALIPMPQPVPQHPDDNTKQVFYSGATHQFDFGAANSDKWLCVWSRWFNSKHPELAGDWNEMQTVHI